MSASTSAPPVTLIPREVLFGNPEKAAPKLSPDGRLLAYLAPDEGVLNVFVRTLGQQDDRAITKDRHRGIQVYFWAPDSTQILYVQDTGGNENFHIFQTNVATQETVDLTPGEQVRAGVVALDPQHPEFMLVSTNARNPQVFDVYRYTFATGALELVTENPGDVLGWTADNDLEVRAATAMLPGGVQEIRVRNDAQEPWRPLIQWGPEETSGGVAGFSPGNRAVWIISSVDANTARLMEMDLASGDRRTVAEDPQYDISGAMINPRTHALEAVAFTRAKTEWQVFDERLAADFAVLRQVQPGELSVTSRDLADQHWVVAFSSDVAPARYYLYHRQTQQAEFLFATRPSLEAYALAPMEPIRYTARDGLNIEGYLTMPPGIAQPVPMVLLVHGGPWARDTWGYSPMTQLLANRGYGVLQVNFRGSTGYGKQFLHAGDREWAARMHDDLLDAKQWAIDHGYADPQRLAIAGGSYGGYATLVGLTFTPEEFTCGVDIVGPSNLITLLQSIPPYWAPMRAIFDTRVGHLETEQEFLRERSPLFRADRITKPLLIGQGANDPRVKQPESDQIVAAMRQNGQEVTYLVFPDEGHGFARPENSRKFMAAMEEFLAEHLGGRAEPPSGEEQWTALLR